MLFEITLWLYRIEILAPDLTQASQLHLHSQARRQAGLGSFNTRKQGSIFHAVNDLLIGGAKGG